MSPSDRGRTRREFLRRFGEAAALGGVFGLPAHVYRRALGAGGTPAPSERIRIGCIGVGNQGRNNLARHLPSVVGVCDVDKGRLAQAKARVEKANGGSCAAYGDFRRLLADNNVDAVVVTTPDHWHALITVHACAAGKDVYCEKPLSLTIAEGRAMVEAARKHRRVVQTGTQQRSAANFRRACELVRSGSIGRVHTVRVGVPGVNFTGPAVPDSKPPAALDFDFWLGPAPKRPYNAKRVHYNFRFFWDYSGGQITNWGAHHLDIAQWGLGMDGSGPVAAEGRAGYNQDGWYEVPEWFEVVYRYANGVALVCGTGQKDGITFQGTTGTVYVNRGKLEVRPARQPAAVPVAVTRDRRGNVHVTRGQPVSLPRAALKPAGVHLYVSNDHHANWLECIKTRRPPIADVEIGHRSATVCHLGNIAVRTGRKIVWDPVQEAVVGDAEAARMVSRPYRAPWNLPEA
jgi:predicted dehydrogenase